MGAWASALPPLTVEPGDEASCPVRVRNTGAIVDQFTFEVLGEAARWAHVEPDSLSLFPGTEGQATLSFRPPRLPTTPAAIVPFGLKVNSKEEAVGSVVEESTLEIGRFDDGFAELVPRTSRGRLAGQHELAFDNRGNGRVDARLTAADLDGLLTFGFKPPALPSEPGTATFSKLRVRPRKRLWWGPPRTYAFEVLVAQDGAEPLKLDGSMLQEALIPRWLVPALLALGALALVWAFLLQPKIESTARDAVKKPLARQAGQIAAAKQQAADAQQTANAANQAAGGQSGKEANNGSSGGSTNTAAATTSEGDPTSGRLQVSCPPQCSATFVVPSKRSFRLTDLVLQNPDGDSGALLLRRDGQVVLAEGLDNFRDLDFHFVAPLLLEPRHRLVLQVRCEPQTASATAGKKAATRCTPAVYFAGFMEQRAKHVQ
jgi:hypothetical protein